MSNESEDGRGEASEEANKDRRESGGGVEGEREGRVDACEQQREVVLAQQTLGRNHNLIHNVFKQIPKLLAVRQP
jgi:hypothetical protein